MQIGIVKKNTGQFNEKKWNILLKKDNYLNNPITDKWTEREISGIVFDQCDVMICAFLFSELPQCQLK